MEDILPEGGELREKEGILFERNQRELVHHAVFDSQCRCTRRPNHHLHIIDMLITLTMWPLLPVYIR